MLSLVIKIPEKWFDDMVKEEFIDIDELCAVIQHSTQLPKGHGRLIDMKNLQNFVSRYTEYDAIQLILADREDYIPTIIEADREE